MQERATGSGTLGRAWKGDSLQRRHDLGGKLIGISSKAELWELRSARSGLAGTYGFEEKCSEVSVIAVRVVLDGVYAPQQTSLPVRTWFPKPEKVTGAQL